MSKRVFALSLAWVFVISGVSFAEKSMWQKFKDFFNPGESVDCEGPVCDEIHNLDEKISKVEGKFSRERRPSNKERYKKELDSLNVVRDSLVAIVMVQQSSSSTLSSSSALLSSSTPLSSSARTSVTSSAAVVAALPTCKPDTIFLRDTVVVHDTLYVVLTNKPAEAPASSSSSETLESPDSSASSK